MPPFPNVNRSAAASVAVRAALLLGCVVIWNPSRLSGGEDGEPLTPTPSFDSAVEPFVATYCAACHGDDEPEAGLSLTRFTGADAVTQSVESRDAWRRVIRQLRGQVMPPEDAEQPSLDARREIVAWLEEEMHRVDCSGPRQPGRVTLRRLNRAEYTNTVRDLLGVSYDATQSFPRDDVGYGFDNIGDVLSLSPMHLEKFLDAAEQIARLAITAPEDATEVNNAPRNEIDPTSIRGGDFSSGEYIALATNDRVTSEVTIPTDGEYLVRTRAYAMQAGDEVAKMRIHFDGQPVAVIEVAAEEGDPAWYAARVNAHAGKRTIGVEFINDFYRPAKDGDEGADRNLYLVGGEVLGPVERTPPQPAGAAHGLLGATPTIDDWRSEAWRAAARVAIHRFTSKAFRRPARDDEVERMIELVDAARREGQSYERGMQNVVAAVLVSPKFLFRGASDMGDVSGAEAAATDENGEGANGVDETADDFVDEYELASRLSYFLWSSTPDETLFELAKRGELRRNLEAQVTRMLDDPRSSEFVRNFIGQWLETRRLRDAAPDPRRFPEFDDALRDAMIAEPEALFAEMVRDDLSVLTLLDADFTFLNERLAKHYGRADVTGDAFRRVALGASDHRGGVLTMAAVLTLTSETTRPSAVKRGKWVLENLHNAPPPDPPAGTPLFEDAKKAAPNATAREQMELHRQNPTCASCHRAMDPIGFALENYDAIGRWRETDGDQPIDASGELPGGRAFDGAAGLKKLLVEDQAIFRKCLVEKMLTYALGRGLEYYDQCTVSDITEQTAAEGDRVRSLVLAIVRSAPFQRRGKILESE